MENKELISILDNYLYVLDRDDEEARRINKAVDEIVDILNERTTKCEDRSKHEVYLNYFVFSSFDLDDTCFLENLGLSVGAYNCLRRAAIFSINDFCNLTAEKLWQVRNLGKHRFVEIAYALRDHGVIIGDLLDVAYELKKEDEE